MRTLFWYTTAYRTDGVVELHAVTVKWEGTALAVLRCVIAPEQFHSHVHPKPGIVFALLSLGALYASAVAPWLKYSLVELYLDTYVIPYSVLSILTIGKGQIEP